MWSGLWIIALLSPGVLAISAIPGAVIVTGAFAPVIILCARAARLAEILFFLPGRGICMAWAALFFLAVVHCLVNPGLAGLAGVGVIAAAVPAYLLGRLADPRRARVLLAAAGLVEAVALIATHWAPGSPWGGIYGIAHFSGFYICLAILIAPTIWRLALMAIGVPGIIMSGSEEGLLFLGVLGGIWFIRQIRRPRDLKIGAFALAVLTITLGILVPTGHFREAHGNMVAERFDTLNNATHYRSDNYEYTSSYLTGSGWTWDTNGNTTHNAAWKLAGMFSVLGAFLWMLIMALGVPWQVFVFLMIAAMVDHFLTTYLFLVPWLLVGLCHRRAVFCWMAPKPAENRPELCPVARYYDPQMLP